ncbi:MAG: tRNA (adenosine(37)-N6)-dimethylallyltransferase MiaA [Holosporales bacterium]|jgi:tRNA dimethylallyltransferase|nr:tRNA (adenosine(37)-N6)-dimethylallyltransferase MiaA [Holosporales bacterium]
MEQAIVVAGPTASGKTKYAVSLAQELNGEIINFDSLQVYKDLKILTAYPAKEEQNLVKHKLFGYLNYNEKTNVASWAKLASIEIKEIFLRKKTPILTGGTGLYINTLINGISELPEVSDQTRHKAEELAKINYDLLCKTVYQNDKTLESIITRDKNRQMIRAYEILLETGKSISAFYAAPKKKFISNVDFEFRLINIDRKKLYERISLRFNHMLKNGAIEEVENLLQKMNSDNLKKFPIFNAIGAKEISLFLKGRYSFEKMKEIACQNSRRYAKRQITWFKYQIPKNCAIKIQ